MSALRDSLGRALMLGLGLTALLGLGGSYLFDYVGAPPSPQSSPVLSGRASEPSRPSGTGELPAARTEVVEVVGAVERTRGTHWVVVAVGDALAPDDSVRTGPGARVDLRVGNEASRLSIPERSEVRVGEVTSAVHTLRLERGRIDVDYREWEDRVLRVQSESGAVAETRAAHFSMVRRGGMVAVVTRGGSVDLSAAGATVQVGAGQQSVVFDGAAPLAAEPIPVEVLLKVAAQASAGDSLCLSLSGQVHVGTEVLVEGEATEVSRDGSFRAAIPRQGERSQVRVLAREPGGAERELLMACRPRSRPPRAPVESVKFRWKEAP